eukprot:6198974-Pleurochrysis_carterae.AAC.4
MDILLRAVDDSQQSGPKGRGQSNLTVRHGRRADAAGPADGVACYLPFTIPCTVHGIRTGAAFTYRRKVEGPMQILRHDYHNKIPQFWVPWAYILERGVNYLTLSATVSSP